jgi:hypothetical protein
MGTYAINIVLHRAIRRGQDPCDVRDHVERRLQVLDALDHGLLVTSVVEVRVLRHGGGEAGGDGHAAAGDDAAAEVLAEGHGVWEKGD